MLQGRKHFAAKAIDRHRHIMRAAAVRAVEVSTPCGFIGFTCGFVGELARCEGGGVVAVFVDELLPAVDTGLAN